jgi:hypothetical protein
LFRAAFSAASRKQRRISESTELRYARAQTQLAEANLNRVQQSNRRVARSVPSSIVAEYERDVQVAKTRLAQVAAGRAAGEFQVWLQRAEAEHRTEETAWKNAMEVNDRVQGTFDPLDIERFRLLANEIRCARSNSLKVLDRTETSLCFA